jgi:hypothetical protein
MPVNIASEELAFFDFSLTLLMAEDAPIDFAPRSDSWPLMFSRIPMRPGPFVDSSPNFSSIRSSAELDVALLCAMSSIFSSILPRAGDASEALFPAPSILFEMSLSGAAVFEAAPFISSIASTRSSSLTPEMPDLFPADSIFSIIASRDPDVLV